MKKMILKITALSLFAAAIVATPATVRAQDAVTNAPAALRPITVSVQSTNAPVKKHKKHDRSVFSGKLTRRGHERHDADGRRSARLKSLPKP